MDLTERWPSRLWRAFLRSYWHGRTIFYLLAANALLGMAFATWMYLSLSARLPMAIVAGLLLVSAVNITLTFCTRLLPYVDECGQRIGRP